MLMRLPALPNTSLLRQIKRAFGACFTRLCPFQFPK